MQFKGKNVLVTGGTSGIGKAIALAFTKQGASVAIFGTDETKAKAALHELEAARTDNCQRFVYDIVDVSNGKAVESSVKKILDEWKTIDILVNNAGITRDNLLMRMTEEEWDRVVDVNLKSIYNTCHALIRHMMKARGGKIINISSVIGLTGNAGQANYASSKAGMIGFSKSLAKEVAGRNICVNCVAPGYIATQMTQDLPDQVKETILSRIPQSRIGHPDDVAHAVLFLASNLADYITGQVLSVDGGMV
jgi:3-oxoacyl-[acyl-carrier protein] reductase